jgi:hypothetical protein
MPSIVLVGPFEGAEARFPGIAFSAIGNVSAAVARFGEAQKPSKAPVPAHFGVKDGALLVLPTGLAFWRPKGILLAFLPWPTITKVDGSGGAVREKDLKVETTGKEWVFSMISAERIVGLESAIQSAREAHLAAAPGDVALPGAVVPGDVATGVYAAGPDYARAVANRRAAATAAQVDDDDSDDEEDSDYQCSNQTDETFTEKDLSGSAIASDEEDSDEMDSDEVGLNDEDEDEGEEHVVGNCTTPSDANLVEEAASVREGLDPDAAAPIVENPQREYRSEVIPAPPVLTEVVKQEVTMSGRKRAAQLKSDPVNKRQHEGAQKKTLDHNLADAGSANNAD